MIIEYDDSGPAGILYPYYTVLVGKDEVKTRSGKTIPHCWIGTISPAGKINMWRPAGYCPRDYKPKAMELLELAKKTILNEQESIGGPLKGKTEIKLGDNDE